MSKAERPEKSVVFLRVHTLYLSADNLIHFRPWVWCHMTVIQLTLATELHAFFFFNDTATTEIYTLSLHDALPI